LIAPSPERPAAPPAAIHLPALRPTLNVLVALVASGLALTVFVMAGEPAAVDSPTMRAAQDVGGMRPLAWLFNDWLHTQGIPAMWLATILALVALRRWDAGAFFVLAALVAPANHVMKLLVDRPRPSGSINILEYPSGTSFPSGHTSMAVAFFGAWILLAGALLPPRAVLPVRLAALVAILLTAYSRLWVGAHWPTDVTASILFGSASLVALWLLVATTAPRAALLAERMRGRLHGAVPALPFPREFDAE